MPIDINILCVKQKKEIVYNKKVFILEKLNKEQTDGFFVYPDNWFLYNSIIGNGYNLYSRKIKDATYDIVDYIEKKEAENYFKNMLQDCKSPSNGTLDELNEERVVFNEACQNDFRTLLENTIKSSEIKTCVVFFRIQACCPERYVGRISLKQFLTLLKNKEIYLNTAYIISEADYD